MVSHRVPWKVLSSKGRNKGVFDLHHNNYGIFWSSNWEKGRLEYQIFAMNNTWQSGQHGSRVITSWRKEFNIFSSYKHTALIRWYYLPNKPKQTGNCSYLRGLEWETSWQWMPCLRQPPPANVAWPSWLALSFLGVGRYSYLLSNDLLTP